MNQQAQPIEEEMDSDADLTIVGPGIVETRSEFLRPTYSFKGAELFPFTYGYEILFNQIRDREDTGLYTWMAFVFMLRRRGKESAEDHRKWLINLAWKVEDFRDALIKWMDETGPFSPEDKLEAQRIFRESMDSAAAYAVQIVPGKGARTMEKKTRRRKKL